MLTLSQLEQHLPKAAWILKGPVDAADFKVYIFPLLFFKRISDSKFLAIYLVFANDLYLSARKKWHKCQKHLKMTAI
jgi:type I restriction-modification system DNA methylase subunit